ncbi:MAG: agmatine/peptidylarginine deiminase [Gammaproteobacteria bacterium]
MTTPSTASPRRLPAEWEPQDAVMVTWPYADSDWKTELAGVEPVFAAIASRVSRHERVIVTCRDEAHREHISAQLARARTRMEAVHFFTAPSNDVWVRDHGPITLIEDGRPVLCDYTFNGWGGKYEAAADNEITRRLHAQGAFGATPLRRSDFVLEGGSIESDGQGTLLTTTQCLLAPTRNPGWTRERIDGFIKEELGVERVLWIEHGWLAGDDTDSHIDQLARFCDQRTIAYTACDTPADEHYPELRSMAAELAALRDSAGQPYILVPLPLPQPRRDRDGRRLAASYANFLVVNDAVLVPVYGDPADQVALDRLAGCFPGRAIIDLPCLPLISQNGSLHCATMQIPAGVLSNAAAGTP